MAQVWDRHLKTRETPTAHRAFMDYCRMGTKRSLRSLAERYTEQDPSSPPAQKPPTIYVNTLFDWSLRHEWQRRVRAWDVNEERLKAEDNRDAIREMNKRHAQIAIMGQSKSVDKLQELPVADLTVTEAIRLLVEATRLERLARGEPVTIETHEHRGPDGGPIPVKYVVVHLSGEEQDDQHDGSDGHDGGDGSQAPGQDPALDP